LKPFLWIMGSVPVRRRQDQAPGGPAREDAGPVEGAPARVDNSEAFDALFSVLEEGEAFGIFPEGISHTRPELAPLKTGAARIALGAAAKGVPVRIVPVGLTYRRRDRMRSRVLVQLGEPVVVEPGDVDAHGADPITAARTLTAKIGNALRALTINAPDFDQLRVLDGVRRLYRPAHVQLTLAQQAELMRRFLGGYERLKDSDHEVQQFYDDVDHYLLRLRSLGLSDRELRGDPSLWTRIEKLVRHAFFFFVLVPIAIPGIFLHLPVLATAVVAGAALTDRGDVRATIKVVAATVLTLVAYAAVAVAVVLANEPPDGYVYAVVTLAGLLLSGWATIRVLERQADVRRGLGTLVALLHLEREIRALVATRDALRTRLLVIVDKHIGDLERIIDREDQKDAHPWLDDEDAD
jgi:glycerol-3-phosphate O-acyltransferase/dihydroxyacetone phosphate acyltransferase